MKRYNLDQTWELCLKMWKWIAKKCKKEQCVASLKEDWLKNNGFEGGLIDSSCFFCQYASSHKRRKSVCSYCPGVKVDPDFDCFNYPNYGDNPIEFYKLLLALNRKRKKK